MTSRGTQTGVGHDRHLGVCLTEAVGVHGQRVLLPGVPGTVRCRRPRHRAETETSVCSPSSSPPRCFKRDGLYLPAQAGAERGLIRQPEAPAPRGTEPGRPWSLSLPAGSEGLPAPLTWPRQALVNSSQRKHSPVVFSMQRELERRGRLLSQRDVRGLLSMPAPGTGSQRQKGLTGPRVLRIASTVTISRSCGSK